MRFDNFQTKINSYKKKEKKKPQDRRPASSRKYFDIALEEIKREENSIRLGYDKDTKRWKPHKSLEGGEDTLAYGTKLNKGKFSDEDIKRFYKEGISEEEAIKLSSDRMKKDYKELSDKAGSDLSTFMNDNQIAALLSYWTNAGHLKHPNLEKALKKRDIKDISKEMNAGGFTKPDGTKGSLQYRRDKEQLLFNKPVNNKEGRNPASIEEQNMNEELGQKAGKVKEAKKRLEEQAAVGEKQQQLMEQDVEKAKPVVEKVIMNDHSQTPNEKENNVANLNNKQAVKNSIDRNMENPKAKQGMGLKDQFLDALTFFGPQLLGGFLASGGKQDEYFVAGFNQGGKMRDAYLAQKNTEAKLEVQRENQRQAASLNKMDITPDFQTKTDGKPVWSRQNPETGLPEFIDDTGKKYSATDVVSMRAVQDKARQESITGRHQQNLSQRDTDRVIKSMDNFVKRGDVMKTIQAMDSTSPVINMLKSGQPVSQEFLAPFIARGVQGEVGNLSETDLANARVPLDLGKRIISNLSSYLTGDMSDAERDALVKMLEYVQSQKQAQLEQKTMGYATQSEAERLGITQEALENDLRNRLGLKVKKVRKKAKITNNDIDNMSADELRKYLGE